MSWISIIPFSDAEGQLRRLYERVKGPEDYIDNILQVHSLRPHTLKGHMALYKNVLHHAGNTLPKWLLETIGVYVSMLNRCTYCVEHHAAGLRRLLRDDNRTQQICQALANDQPAAVFNGAHLALMWYARKLTLEPAGMTKGDIDALRQHGLSDGEILEANQVVSYFAYANRTVMGLGVTTDGDILGLSPATGSEDEWAHH
ncbi:MAG: peroxidase-related enzyme [Saprospiraceae bacterium]|nr:peroxidase-related enzyme [Saprospiraceae bacterium]